MSTGSRRTNHILVTERRTGLFVTVLCGVLELDTGLFTFANAGHELPLLGPADGSPPRWIEGGGPLVGMFDRLGIEPQLIDIEPGEQLVLFTDGITDAAAPGGGRFGGEGLRRAVAGPATRTATETSRGVIGAVLDFQGATDPADDLALLVIRRLPDAGA